VEQEIVKAKLDLKREIEEGGTEAPCPFCQIPRMKRSDYIRCCKCGVNWLKGEDLTKDPRMSRNAVKSQTTTSKWEKKEDAG